MSGWDAAGTVVTAAADGCGPPAGARVVTFGWSGAWGRLRAVDAGELAVLPEQVGFEEAAALPVAAVTALRAIRGLGSVLGRTVLISGASGGVGRFAVQLASLAGARVVACVGSSARAEGLAELGADQVVVGLDGLAGPVEFAIDSVGRSAARRHSRPAGPGRARDERRDGLAAADHGRLRTPAQRGGRIAGARRSRSAPTSDRTSPTWCRCWPPASSIPRSDGAGPGIASSRPSRRCARGESPARRYWR